LGPEQHREDDDHQEATEKLGDGKPPAEQEHHDHPQLDHEIR